MSDRTMDCHVFNSAKMREALESVRNWCLNRLCNSSYQVTVEGLLSVVTSALAAPPRNCDLYRTKKERDAAYEDYRKYVIMSNSNPYIAEAEMMSKEDWLFAEAKGEAK